MQEMLLMKFYNFRSFLLLGQNSCFLRHLLNNNMLTKVSVRYLSIYHCFGPRSVLDPDSILSVDPDPDSDFGSGSEVLDVLF
jgi:hypothetical protein